MGDPRLETFCILLHVTLYFEALGCLHPILDIIDLFYALLTCNMTLSLCKELYLNFKVFVQLAYVLKFLCLFSLF